MTNHYTTLGVQENASHDEIKRAYKKLANRHHPDKGGDQDKFKDIAAAYDTIGDPQRRQEYDQQRFSSFGGHGGFHTQFHTSDFGGFHDIFGSHFANMFRHQPHTPRNRDLNLNCKISLADSFNGKQFETKFTLPSGKQETVFINIPAGIDNGDTIRYNGLGDDSIPNVPRGDLNVTITVNSDGKFDRRGNDLYTTVEINPIEAIIGCTKQVTLINGESSMVDIRPGVETGVEFTRTHGGFTNIHTKAVGRFVMVVKIKTPTITDPVLLAKLSDLNNELSLT